MRAVECNMSVVNAKSNAVIVIAGSFIFVTFQGAMESKVEGKEFLWMKDAQAK